MNIGTRVGTLILMMVAGLTAHAGAAPRDEYHYTLKRAVYRLELGGTPVARILCTVRDDVSGASDTVIWDPEDRRGAVRYALLPSGRQQLSPEQAVPLAKSLAAKLIPILLQPELEAAETARKALMAEVAKKGSAATLKQLRSEADNKQRQFAAAATALEPELVQWLAVGLDTTLRQTSTDVDAMSVAFISRAGPLSPGLQRHKTKLEGYFSSQINRAWRQLLIQELGLTALHPVVACRSEHRVVDGGDGSDTILWYVDPESGTDARERYLTVESSVSGAGAAAPVVTVRFESVTGPERERVLDQRNDGVQTSRLRSLDPTTALATDALTALATVALERANDAGKEYARRAMREFLCDHLTVGEIQRGLKGSVLAETLEKLNWPAEQHLLRNTCALIDTLRIDELVSAKDAIWKAVGIDAAALASAFLANTLSSNKDDGLKNVLGGVAGLVSNALTSGSTTTERDAQVLLLTLARIGIPRDVDDRSEQRGWRYAVELGMAVLQECLRVGECSADELERLLDEEIELDRAASVSGWAELPAILGRAASVLRPPPGTSPTTTAANAILVLLDVVERALGQVVVPDAQKLNDCLPLKGRPLSVLEKVECQGLRLTDDLDVQESISFGLLVGQTLHTANGKALCLSPGQAAWVQAHLNKTPRNTTPSDPRIREQPSCSTKGHVAFAAGVLTSEDEEEVLKVVANIGWKRQIDRALALLRTLRGVAAALQGGDVTTVVVDLGKVLETAVTDECERQGAGKKCRLPVTSAQLRKGFRILSALAAYGASYRKAEDGEDSGELEKLRAEEREKAMESLIDSVTDRSERHSEMIFSLGANVAISAEYRWVPGGGLDYWNRVPLSMPVGIAFQRLPNQGTTFLGRPGGHVMLSVLDLTQYATVGGEPEDKNDAKLSAPEPEFGTALRLGVEVGLLFGEPSFPITACVNTAWIPHVNYDGDERDEWSFGGSVGVFIPFIDFN